MTLAIKLLPSRITSAPAVAKMAGRFLFAQSSFPYKPINPTIMIKIQLNAVSGGTPPANPFKATTQYH